MPALRERTSSRQDVATAASCLDVPKGCLTVPVLDTVQHVLIAEDVVASKCRRRMRDLVEPESLTRVDEPGRGQAKYWSLNP